MVYELDQEEKGWKGEEQTGFGLDLQFAKEAKATFMGRAKGIFDDHVLRSVFKGPSPRSADGLKEALKKLQQLGKNAMNNMIIARIEIMNPIDDAQVFFLPFHFSPHHFFFF